MGGVTVGRYILLEESQDKLTRKKLTKPTTVNTTLLQKNKRHLQQVHHKEGTDTKSPCTTLCKNTGYNNMSRKALRGEALEDFEAAPEISAWVR